MPIDERVYTVQQIDNAWARQGRAHCLDINPANPGNKPDPVEFPPLSQLLPIQASELKRLIIKHGQPGCGGTLYLRGAHIQGHLNLEGLTGCNGAPLPRLCFIQCLFDDGINFTGAYLAHISLWGSRFSLNRSKKDRPLNHPDRHIVGDSAIIRGDVDLSQIRPIVYSAGEDSLTTPSDEVTFPDELDPKLRHDGSRTLLLSLQSTTIRDVFRIENSVFRESFSASQNRLSHAGKPWYAVNLGQARIEASLKWTPGVVILGGLNAAGLLCKGEAWFAGIRITAALAGQPGRHASRRALNLQSAVFCKSLVLSQDFDSLYGGSRKTEITGPISLYAADVKQQLMMEGIVLRKGPLTCSGATFGAIALSSPEARDSKSKFSGINTVDEDDDQRWKFEADEELPLETGCLTVKLMPGTVADVQLANSRLGRLKFECTKGNYQHSKSVERVNLTGTVCSDVVIDGVIENTLDLSGALVTGDCKIKCSVPTTLLNQSVVEGSLDLRAWSTREPPTSKHHKDGVSDGKRKPVTVADLPRLAIQNAKIGSKLHVAEFERLQACWAWQAELGCYPDYKLVFSKAKITDGDNRSESTQADTPLPPKSENKAFLAFLEDPKGNFHRLHGGASVFHELNKVQPPHLTNKAQVVEYLVLFCSFLWADGGPFRVFSADSMAPQDKARFSWPAKVSESEPGLVVSVSTPHLFWQKAGGTKKSKKVLFEDIQWKEKVTDTPKVIAQPKVYDGLQRLDDAIRAGDFKDLPIYEWPQESSVSSADGEPELQNWDLQQSNFNRHLHSFVEQNKSSGNTDPHAWYVVASVWYQEALYACLFMVTGGAGSKTETNIEMLGEVPLFATSKPDTATTARKTREDGASEEEGRVCLPWVPMEDYEAFERRKGGQAALITLRARTDGKTSSQPLDVKHYLGTTFRQCLEPYREYTLKPVRDTKWQRLTRWLRTFAKESIFILTWYRRAERWWAWTERKLWPHRKFQRSQRQRKKSRVGALWKGWGWSRTAYVDLSGAKCGVLEDASGRGWGDSVYFKTDRFDFETVARKEADKQSAQGNRTPREKKQLILSEFTWKDRDSSERIDYTNEPNMSYFELRLLWLSRYRMNDQSAIEPPNKDGQALTDSAEDDLNRWFEPGTFRSFARVYRNRSLDQGALYLDECLMRLRGWHLRWHLFQTETLSGRTAFQKCLFLVSIAILGGLLALLSATWGPWVWLFAVAAAILLPSIQRLLKLLAIGPLWIFDALFRWGFRYGLSLSRPLLTIFALLIIGTWTVEHLNNRGLMVVETTFAANQVGFDERTHIFSTGTYPATRAIDVKCGSNIDSLLYALDKFIPLIEIDQDHRCLIRPFDDKLDIPYSAIFGESEHTDPEDQQTPCESGAWRCHVYHGFEVFFGHPYTWRFLQSFYVVLGWIVISITLLTFSGVLKKHAEGR